MILKIKFLGLVFGVILIASSAFSQNLTEEDLLLPPGQLLEEDLSGIGNSTLLDQVGSQNITEVNQQQTGEAKINLAKVLQSGDLNEAFLYQKGSGNQTALIQSGTENFYQLNVDGNDNEMVILQDGDRNKVIQDLYHTDELNIEFLQIGNDNEIIQLLDGISNQEFKLIQSGDGMRAIIQNPQ